MSRQNKDNKVDDFRLDLVDDRTHKQLWCMRFSRIGFIVSVISAIVLIIFIFYAIFAFSPLRRTIPGYPDESSKKEAIRNAIRVDSLEKIISRWELYSENLRRVVHRVCQIEGGTRENGFPAPGKGQERGAVRARQPRTEEPAHRGKTFLHSS